MQEFLHVSEKKLKSKGVQSVKSRVVNLKELCPQMTLELLEENLFEAFQEVYGCAPKPLLETRIDWAKVKERAEFLSSWEWLYGRKIPFQTEWTDRFSWGEIQIQAAVDEGLSGMCRSIPMRWLGVCGASQERADRTAIRRNCHGEGAGYGNGCGGKDLEA